MSYIGPYFSAIPPTPLYNTWSLYICPFMEDVLLAFYSILGQGSWYRGYIHHTSIHTKKKKQIKGTHMNRQCVYYCGLQKKEILSIPRKNMDWFIISVTTRHCKLKSTSEHCNISKKNCDFPLRRNIEELFSHSKSILSWRSSECQIQRKSLKAWLRYHTHKNGTGVMLLWFWPTHYYPTQCAE